MSLNIVFEDFKSLSHLIYELENRPNNRIMCNEHSSQKNDNPDWSGTKTYAEAVKFAHDHGVKAHVTVNIMPRNDEAANLPAYLEQLDDAGELLRQNENPCRRAVVRRQTT